MSHNLDKSETQPPYFVQVPAPNAQAGLGHALREAFAVNGGEEADAVFDQLLAKLR